MADNGNKVLDIFNKMQNYPPLNTVGNSISRNWCEWRHKFLSFLQKEDGKELYKNQWTTILFKLVGPLGEEAYKNLFQTTPQTTDLGIVLRKLDLYFIFGLRKRQNNESIDKYVDSLMLVAIASNHSNPVNIVKEKIIEDITNYNFTGKAMLLIQSKGKDLESYLQSLDFHHITLFWKQCEELELQKCVRCGTCHSRNSCPAHGVRCNNCQGYNHFTINCKVKYVSDCTRCGTNHVQSRCLAFGELCTICGKRNHFSRLCQVPIVKDCLRCGGDHAISMCPAQGRACSRCKKPNHFEEKCLSKLMMNKNNNTSYNFH